MSPVLNGQWEEGEGQSAVCGSLPSPFRAVLWGSRCPTGVSLPVLPMGGRILPRMPIALLCCYSSTLSKSTIGSSPFFSEGTVWPLCESHGHAQEA